MNVATKTATEITIPDLPDGEHAVLTKHGKGWDVNIYHGDTLTIAVGYAESLATARDLLQQIYE